MGGPNGINGTNASKYNAGDPTDDGLTTVEVGETSLSQVAQRLGVDLDRLKGANPQVQDPTHLNAGQNLHLPQAQPRIDPIKTTPLPQLYAGQPALAVPHFSLSMRHNEASLDVLDRMPFRLHPNVIPGTPLNGKFDADNLSSDEIINPSLHIGKRVFAEGTLSLGLPYLKHSVDPTEVSVEFNSVPLTSIHPQIANGRIDLGQIGRVRMNALGIGRAKGDVRIFFALKQINAALARSK